MINGGKDYLVWLEGDSRDMAFPLVAKSHKSAAAIFGEDIDQIQRAIPSGLVFSVLVATDKPGSKAIRYDLDAKIIYVAAKSKVQP